MIIITEILLYDIQAALEVAIDVKLRESWPITELLEALSDSIVFENIEETKSDLMLSKNGDKLSGESALWSRRCSLHE